MNTRVVAARVINQVTNGASLADCLEPMLATLNDARDRAFVQAVCFGVCRYYTRLDVILSQLLKKPMHAKDTDIHALLLVGLYQLIDMRVPPHAAVAETVNATEAFNKPWSRGLVNAILREYLRAEEKLKQSIADDEEALYAHPAWWILATKKAWPKEWQSILTANNAHPPLAIRVNQTQYTRADYLKKLQTKSISADSIAETQAGIVLNDPMPVEGLPAFAAGAVSVQDGAAQIAVELLDLVPGQIVLDACAAPGGKLTHILEAAPELEKVIAIDVSRQRLALVKENVARLQLNNQIVNYICEDVSKTQAWWDQQAFDRILLDAPCSASGVVRRHPDIKLLREPADIKTLAKQQLQLINSLWPLLKPNGILVYATCSIFPEENEQVIKQFFAAHADAHEIKIEADWGQACEFGRQILPGMHGMDGFYYAKMVKS